MTKKGPIPAVGFAERLAYLRWLRARGRLAAESDRDVVDWLGVGESWFRKWKGSARAPEGRTEAAAIEESIADMGATIRWLYDGEGRAPAPALWKEWYETWVVIQAFEGSVPEIPPSDFPDAETSRDRGTGRKGA